MAEEEKMSLPTNEEDKHGIHQRVMSAFFRVPLRARNFSKKGIDTVPFGHKE